MTSNGTFSIYNQQVNYFFKRLPLVNNFHNTFVSTAMGSSFWSYYYDIALDIVNFFLLRFLQGKLHGRQLAVVDQTAKRFTQRSTRAQQSSVDWRFVQFGKSGSAELQYTNEFHRVFEKGRWRNTVVLGHWQFKLCFEPYETLQKRVNRCQGGNQITFITILVL